MSRRKQAVPARRTEFPEGAVGTQEVEASADGQIGDIQEVDEMDHRARTVSTRETRSSSSSSQHAASSKKQKTGGTKPHRLPVMGERPGLRRTQRKNAAQRYKLGKLAAAEENRMIGAELRSERRRSTEGVVAKGKTAGSGAKKTKGTAKAAADSLPVNRVKDDLDSMETDAEKAGPILNGSPERQVDDLLTSSTLPAQVKGGPAPEHHITDRPPSSTESDLQPLNLATGNVSSNCLDLTETGEGPSPPEDDSNTSSDLASAFSRNSDSPHQHPNDADPDRGRAGETVSGRGDWGCAAPRAASEEVGTESVSQSDSPSGERTPTPTGEMGVMMMMAEGCNGGISDGGKVSYERLGGSTSDDTSPNSPWKKNFKRRRPMEEGNTSLTCPVCSEEFENKHNLTMHFREHNTITSDGTMHACKLCGKKLSSTSSLDRHMLIHSGERPHHCPICPMSFTTNGNMRRHIRTHEKSSNSGGSSGIASEGDYVTEVLYSKQRKRFPSKRILDVEDVEGESSPSKRIALNVKDSPTKIRLREDELTCPICNKTFLCHYGLQTHMELHPNVLIKCDQCEATFKNHRGLRMHVLMSHKKASPVKPASTSDVPLGFQDLGYVADISCNKFPLIAQEWCELNVRRCNSAVHRFICQLCNKAFPCSSALDLHRKKNHISKADNATSHTVENVSVHDGKENYSTDDAEPTNIKEKYYNQLRQTYPTQEQFMATLLLKPNPSTKDGGKPSNSQVPLVQLKAPSNSKVLPSHKVSDAVHAERDFADVGKILTLTTSASSNPLLMLKDLSRGVKHSPVKASVLAPTSTVPALKPKAKVSSFTACKPPPAHSHFPGQGKARQADHEPRSPDTATEMHFPTEVARDECKMDQSADTCDETSSEFGTESEQVQTEKPEKASAEEKSNKKYTCKYCQESFPQYSSLKIHLRTHMGLTPFKCLLCDYSSADKSTLVRHMRTHSGERPYSCKMCDFPFTTKANCERHIKKRHGKESKLEIEMSITHNSGGSVVGDSTSGKFRTPDTYCKLCNREFRFFRDLQNHLKVHQRTPSKPFFCLKCQTGFSSKNNCTRHITKCHPEITKDDVDNYMMVKQVEVHDITQTMANSFASNGEQLSPIDFSKKSHFTVSDGDLSDQSWLSAYTLPDLTDVDAPIDLSLPKDKRSSFLPSVENSMGRLRFKRVYHKFYSRTMDALVCPHCSQSFARGSIFKEHIRSHTTERPHRCYYCKAAFTMKDSLEKHIERRHSDESKSESPAQSFIPKIATPMQFKLMSRSSQGLRVRIDLDKADDNTDGTKPETENPSSLLQSPGSSFGSDASGELASVSKILAASSNNFQVCFPQTGTQTKHEIENEEVVDASNKELSIKEEFVTGDAADEEKEWSQSDIPDLDIAEEYDLVIDESLAKSSDVGESYEAKDKTKERTTERDRSNLPTKEMCPYCDRRFPWISSLRRHILTHTGLKPFQCPQCNSSFSTKSNCERHIVRRHCLNVSPGSKVPEYPFTCLEGCSGCDYSTKLKLMKHYEVHHIGTPFPECYKNEVKKLPASIIRNALAKRANKLGSTRSFGSSEFRSRVGMSGVTLKLTRHKQLLKRRHSSVDEKPLALIKRKSLPLPDRDGKSHDLSSKRKHLIFVKGKPFPVVFKKKKKKILPSMVNGVDRSSGSKDLSVSKDDVDLITESLGYVTGEVTAQPAVIKSKSKRKHARHCCSQCCKRFKSATTLKRHYRVHTLEHPFRCTDCSASFTTKFNCQRHMLKLHGKSKEETLPLIEKQRAEISPSYPSSMQSQHSLDGSNSGAESSGLQQDSPNLQNGVPDQDVSDVNGEGSTASRSAAVKHAGGRTAEECVVADGDMIDEDPKMKEDVDDNEADEEDGDLEDDDFAEEQESEEAVMNSDPEVTNDNSLDFEDAWELDSGVPASDSLYASPEQGNCSIVMPSGRGRDVFVSGQTDNSDMIQNLLGIQDSSVLDQMLDSADSAAKLLGVK